MRIAILGAGTYGSYTVNSIQQKYPDSEITVFDVGDRNVKSEEEIGYLSRLKNKAYKGLTNGRYFGWGGASHKWGGQLLTYTDNDFSNPNVFMQELIALDKQYKDKCLEKFNIENKFPETKVTADLFTKTGVWLSMLHRNFFNWFKVNNRKNVKVLSHCRVVKLVSFDKKKIESIVYLENGIEQEKSFDFYFLTAGAFESARILLSSEMTENSKVHFSDHLSRKVFKIKGSTIIGDEDFVFRMRGTSLITKRLIGECNDISYYIHPVFNMKFPFFEMIKDILFYRKFAVKNIGKYILITLKDIPHVIGLAWSVVVLRKMYVMNNEWYMYIDIENPTKDSYVTLANEKDKFGLQGLDVFYNIGNDAVAVFKSAQLAAENHMTNCKVNYEVVAEKIDISTCEDIYHPYGMHNFETIDSYYNHWDNMLVVSTGILPRSGGINPTASLFPIIDEFVNFKLADKC